MVRALRRRKVQRPKKVMSYDEDDPEAYKDMPVPDKKSSEYIKDKIDEFHDEKIAKLLARGVQLENDEEELDDEEEVMALNISETEDDDEEEEEEEEEGTDLESDLEEKKDEGVAIRLFQACFTVELKRLTGILLLPSELPNVMAWGTKKKIFYDSEYVDIKGKSREDLEAEEQEEEEEAKNIQKRLAANLSEEDYDLNFFQEFAVEEKEGKPAEKQERIVKDLKQMSKKEKMKLLKKESPELLELIQDLKAKLSELKEELKPLMQMVKDGKIPPGKGADYLKTKQQLYLNYCTNISFYLVLKAKRIPAHNHPVIERLLTYRNLINELGPVDAQLAPEFHKLLAGDEKEKRSSKTTDGNKTKISSKKDMDSGETLPEDEDSESDLDEEAALRFYREVEERMKLKRKSKGLEAEELKEDHEEMKELDEDGKRGITYQMAKNKGLTAKRKKIDRNPRVKHREKYRRAKIRRKGQVREARREETRYSGEMSGIRAGVKKSVKLK
ncbi:something about silencing protein 10 isoform X1 [Nematolebias whitei]|uniref:something about silencing protein 10 isoform X1 n=1 Tax=Nematolebias whitei TaxID=451745 RepID=UPI00189804AB|nr:something about silencing protein 10 isoform X1 [Nematolebias whitei]